MPYDHAKAAVYNRMTVQPPAFRPNDIPQGPIYWATPKSSRPLMFNWKLRPPAGPMAYGYPQGSNILRVGFMTGNIYLKSAAAVRQILPPRFNMAGSTRRIPGRTQSAAVPQPTGMLR